MVIYPKESYFMLKKQPLEKENKSVIFDRSISLEKEFKIIKLSLLYDYNFNVHSFLTAINRLMTDRVLALASK